MRISICGNIGAGKTTLLEKFKPMLQDALGDTYTVMSMPENFDENPYKEDYYKNPKEYAFRFQTEVFKHRLQQEMLMNELEANNPNTIFLLDRSIHEDGGVFWAYLKGVGVLSNRDFLELFSLKNNAINGKGFQLNNFLIDVITPPNECLENIKKRGRPEEQGIDFNYIRVINEYLENYVSCFGVHSSHFQCGKSYQPYHTALKEELALPKLLIGVLEGIENFYKRRNKQ